MTNMNLGPLQTLYNSVDDPDKPVLRNIIIRMAEIDSRISKSAYRELAKDEQDEPPTGDDYNDLFEAILDEINAVAEGEVPNG